MINKIIRITRRKLKRKIKRLDKKRGRKDKRAMYILHNKISRIDGHKIGLVRNGDN